jgi:hypothetical protein
LSLSPQEAADFFADFAKRVATPRTSVAESMGFSPHRNRPCDPRQACA